MAENQDPQSGQDNAPAPAIMLHTQYIRDLSLEIPHAPEIFRELKNQPDIKVDIDVSARRLHDNFYNVELSFRVDGDVSGQKFFILEMVYAGIASLNVPEEHVEPVLMIELPHMLFPYARQAVTNTLVNGGLPPLMLNPVDFVAMYRARRQAAGEAPAQPQQAND